jgi:hypothetical protein
MDSYICSECGKPHPAEETELSFYRPDKYVKTPFWLRMWRTRCNGDICVLRGRDQFTYGIIEFPVAQREAKYGIGIWVEVKDEIFKRYVEFYNSDRTQPVDRPMSGQLANKIPKVYEHSTLGVEVDIIPRADSHPLLCVRQNSHRLYAEQQKGISVHRIHQYLALVYDRAR